MLSKNCFHEECVNTSCRSNFRIIIYVECASIRGLWMAVVRAELYWKLHGRVLPRKKKNPRLVTAAVPLAYATHMHGESRERCNNKSLEVIPSACVRT